jgi:hypothetical protein
LVPREKIVLPGKYTCALKHANLFYVHVAASINSVSLPFAVADGVVLQKVYINSPGFLDMADVSFGPAFRWLLGTGVCVRAWDDPPVCCGNLALQLKEVVKSVNKTKGITSMAIEGVVNELVDDDLVVKEKVRSYFYQSRAHITRISYYAYFVTCVLSWCRDRFVC